MRHGQQRRGLRQPVDLDEFPAELGLAALDRARGRRGPGDDDPGEPTAGDRPAPRSGGVEDHVQHCGRAAHQRHAVLLDTAQDLGAIDLAQDHVRELVDEHRRDVDRRLEQAHVAALHRAGLDELVPEPQHDLVVMARVGVFDRLDLLGGNRAPR